MYSPHHVTMHFDLTDEDGRTAFEYARLGSKCHRMLFDLDTEMRTCTKHGGPPCDQLGEMFDDDEARRHLIQDTTSYWRRMIVSLMDEYDIPCDV